jgi:hypothetical protein
LSGKWRNLLRAQCPTTGDRAKLAVCSIHRIDFKLDGSIVLLLVLQLLSVWTSLSINSMTHT